jgi:BACON domain-containing protein/fibronectin type III domain protein
MKHVHNPGLVIAARLMMILSAGVLAMASEGFAFPVSPTALSYSASTGSPAPPSQTVKFKAAGKKSLVPRTWTASSNAAWMSVSPASGTISTEQDLIVVQVNATSMTAGTYSGTVRITMASQTAAVPVTLNVTGDSVTPTGTGTATPSILLNPTSLSFSGVQGGPAPLAKPITLSNPTGGTLTWTLTETAAWLGLNVSSGTTTTEIDGISASVSTSGLAAGSYSTAITVSASGSSNSPQIIPVTLTVTPPSVSTATLTWTANTETDLAGYNVYIGTQPGLYGAPVSVGTATSYTVGNLTNGATYYFSVTAVDTDGNESLHSSEVSKPLF